VRRVDGDAVRAAPHDPGARQPGQPGVRALREGEHVQAAVAAEDRVRLGADAVHDAVARPDAEGPAVLPAQPRAGQHVEDLLLVAVHVHGHRPLARAEPVAAQAGARRAGRGPEPPALAAQLAAVEHHGPDVVPVHRHPAAMLVPAVAAPWRNRPGPCE
jgi:hypothetical protein